MEERPVVPEDLGAAARNCRWFFATLVDRDWSVPAGGLRWSCRETLDHLPNALLFYASQLAARAEGTLPRIRNGSEGLSVEDLLVSVEAAAAILEHVVRDAPSSARAYHPAGLADPSGFAAMGCDEILVHSADIAAGLGVEFRAEDGLCRRVLGRLFPWAPTDRDAWESLLWANGRRDLPDLPRQDENWYWHCAPLGEWDGRVARRTAPPGWS